MPEKKNITVFGSGSWGTAIANHLAQAGHLVTIWGRELDVLQAIRSSQRNPQFFPDEILTAGIQTCADIRKSVNNTEVLVFAVPSVAMRDVAREVKDLISSGCVLVSLAKGLEEGSLKTMTQVLCEEFGFPERVSCLSGPSFALEVLRGLPTAVVVASESSETAKAVASWFHFKNFRVYTSTDVLGVELGGVVKNIVALAVGILDGVGMGNNARAAIITRGLAEMQRLFVAMGADERTATGLSGLGDLLLTATGDLSRNRQVGLRLGRGEKLADVLSTLAQVAEAVPTTHKVVELARNLGVSMPIVEQVHLVLEGRSSVEAAITSLLKREQRPEI